MKLLRWLFCALLVLCPLTANAGLRLHGSVSASTGLTSFATLPVGGGGFTSGIQVSPDGLTIVCRVDVFGTYIWNFGTSQWDLLDTVSRMPTTEDPGGGIEIVVAPSNSSIIYKWMGNGKLYRSIDRGVSFVQLTGFGIHDAGGNNGGDANGLFSFAARLDGYKMAVDPLNADVLYVGNNSGVFVSTNASQGTGSTPTFAAVTGITAATTNGSGYNFAFDANGGSTGGKTNILYVSSEGQGIFKMTAPGGSFSLVSGSPTHLSNFAVSPNSVLWGADNNSQNTYKLVSGVWTTYSSATTGVRAKAVVIDPNHSASSTTEHVIVIEDSGTLSVTSNSGTTWGGRLGFTRTATDIPWLAVTNEGYMSTSLIAYNKATDVIWFAEGIGVWTAPGNTSTSFVWTSSTKGIESLEPQSVIASPNTTGQPALSAWDRPFFGIASIGTYPTNQGASYAVSIAGGWGLDWATSDGSTLVGLASWPNVGTVAAGNVSGTSVGLDQTSTSIDDGQSWTPLPISTTSFSTNLTTSAGAAAGTTVLTFGSAIPAWVGRGATVNNTTHAGTVNAYISTVTTTTITLDRNITGVGVSSGDTIKVGFSGSGQVQRYATNASTVSGAVLHFAALTANYVHSGMLAYDLSNTAALPNGVEVLSVSGADVTLTSNISSTVASGDVIQFQDATYGGAIAASSPSNFCMTPSDESPFPYCTTDSGATWNPVVIAGIPRAVSGSTTNASTTVTVADSSNFLTGASTTLVDIAGCIANGTTVQSITDPTHIVISPAASCSAAIDVIRPAVGWSFAHYLNIKNITTDRVTANKFYMYNSQTGKIYVSTDSGATWPIVNVTPTSITATYGINGGASTALKSVPSNAGHLFLTGANTGFQNTALIRSTDGGVTWSAVTGAQGAVTGVAAIGFGKAKPSGGGYPAIYISGQVGGVASLWRSDDNCATWINLGTLNPAGSLDGILDLDGDKNTYGEVYGAFNVNGWFYGTIH